MPKLSKLKRAPKGNAGKYYCYKEAWDRIRNALKRGFYLEAVTLEESIISDRLISYLKWVGAIKSQNGYPSFRNLINKWKKQNSYGMADDECSNLQTKVDKWRENRNEVVHGIVKSYPCPVPRSINNFLKMAKCTAQEGAKLARLICNWTRKKKRNCAVAIAADHIRRIQGE
jgi:hypothetical protein